MLLQSEAEGAFRFFYRKVAPLRSMSIETTEFSKNFRLGFLLENVEKRFGKIYPGLHFRHRFLIKPMSFLAHRVPQIGLAICMPASDRIYYLLEKTSNRPRWGGYVGGKKGRWLVCQRPLCDIRFVKCVCLSPKTFISQGFAGVSL